MLNYIDNILNRITMYRLLLYCLSALLVAAAVLSLFGFLSFSPLNLALSVLFLLVVSWMANTVFAWVFEVPANVESVYLTALILALIISPPASFGNFSYLGFLAWAAIIAQASKYILAIGKKHIFNPAALAVAVTAFAINQSATWWVGTAAMMPVVVVTGLLITRKIRRFDLVLAFILVSVTAIVAFDISKGISLQTALYRSLVNSPLLFLASVMVTEPLTTPPTRNLRFWYAALTGLLFAPFAHIGNIYTTPELALLAGNVFSYIVSPKEKLLLTFRQRIKLTSDTYDFVFESNKQFKFRPGQYLEWTLGHHSPDSRGNRRYFTIASSPTEKEVRLGVKFYEFSSSFKTAMFALKPGDTIVASQLAGDFTMPKDASEKLVFLAGGIGVTPFRSMVQYLLDLKENRDVAMLYSNRTVADIAYKDFFDAAAGQISLKPSYILTDRAGAPASWQGPVGYIDENMILRAVPDYRDRVFYISGPQAMVSSTQKLLKGMGIKIPALKKTFFQVLPKT